MLKITFVCAVFPPEPEPAGVMAHQLATRLAADGHEVTMVVPFPNRPQGSLYPGFSRKLHSRSAIPEGYTVVRCPNWLVGRERRSLHRILENITFGLSGAWAVLRSGRPDVVMLETWPLFATSFSAALAILWGTPYLYYVQDSYPEALEEAGILARGGLLARLCCRWDRWLCARSASVIVISDAMRKMLAERRMLPASRFTVIPNWVDESVFPEPRRENTWRHSQDIADGAFVAMYGGTLGIVSGVEILVEVAALLREHEDILLVCIGEGVRKQEMVVDTLHRALTKIRFLPFQPRERVPEVQAAADVALLTMRTGYSNASVPSKLISYFAAGRPVICAAEASSAVAQIVVEAQAGIVVRPGDPAAIAEAILELKRAPEKGLQMGANARNYFANHFTLERTYRQVVQLLWSTHSPGQSPERTLPGNQIEVRDAH